MSRHLGWLPLLTMIVSAACGGPTYFEGNPEGAPIEELGFPAPDDALSQVGCSLSVGGGRTTGAVVYRSEVEPERLVGFYEEHGDDVVQSDVDRSAPPAQTGQPTVAGIDAHREVAVVPIDGGVEVIAFLDDAPEELACH